MTKSVSLQKLERLASDYQSKAESLRAVIREVFDKSLDDKELKNEIVKAVKRKHYTRTKPHWTQLPKNKKRLKAILKRAAMLRIRNKNDK